MTNQERLQQNNAKIEAIQKALDTKMAAIKGEPIDVWVDFPEELLSTGLVYNFSINEQTMLFSTKDAGTWVYRAKERSFEKIGDMWASSFQMVGDNCWLGEKGYGSYLYDVKNNVLTKYITIKQPAMAVYDQTPRFKIIGDKCLVCHGDKILVHDLTNGSIVEKYNYNTSNNVRTYYLYTLADGNCLIAMWGINGCPLLLFNAADSTIIEVHDALNTIRIAHPLSNGNYLLSTESSDAKGLYLYNAIDYTVTQITDLGYTWNYYHELPNGDCLLASSSSVTKGILLYKASDNTASKLYTADYSWNVFHSLPDGNCFITGNTSKGYALLFYNAIEGTITKITSSKYTNFYPLPDGNWLITSTASNGIYLYNATDKTVTLAFTSGNSWIYLQMLQNGNCLISSSGSGSAGILVYDSLTATITQVHTTGYSYCYFIPLPAGNYLISSSTNTGILYYNIIDNTFTVLYQKGTRYEYFISLTNGDYLIGSSNLNLDSNSRPTVDFLVYKASDNTIKSLRNGGGYRYFQELPNGDCLIGCNNDAPNATNTGVLLYSADAGTLTQIWSTGTFYGVFTPADNGCYIQSTDTKKHPYTLYYTYEDGTVKTTSYNIGAL